MEETQNTTAEAVEKKNGGRTYTRIIIAVIVVVILALGYFFLTDRTPQTPTTAEVVGLIDTKTKTPVARVNDAEIERALYNSMVINLTDLAETQGLDVSDTAIQNEIKNQAVTSLVNNQLLFQTATAEGIVVDDETVDTEYDNIVTQAGGKSALKTQLKDAHITTGMLRENVAEQLVVNQYLDNVLGGEDFSVSETEISSYYDSLVSQVAEGTEVPPLTDVQTQIEEQLVLQKQQALVGSLLESLRTDAAIEILI